MIRLTCGVGAIKRAFPSVPDLTFRLFGWVFDAFFGAAKVAGDTDATAGFGGDVQGALDLLGTIGHDAQSNAIARLH